MRIKTMTCCFTGHIALSLDEIGSILKRLDYEIDNLISQGVTEFICGDMPGFDSIVASLIVIKKRWVI